MTSINLSLKQMKRFKRIILTHVHTFIENKSMKIHMMKIDAQQPTTTSCEGVTHGEQDLSSLSRPTSHGGSSSKTYSRVRSIDV